MVSTGYNYVGFGAAMSADGKFYYAGVFVKEPDHTVPWARMGSVSMRTVDAHHKRVTVRWSGGDTRLQVLTSGLRYFQVAVARRRWQLARLDDEHRDAQVDHDGARRSLRGPGPVA